MSSPRPTIPAFLRALFRGNPGINVGIVHWYHGWDLRASKHELERAVELSPSDANSRLGLATFLASMEADVLRVAAEADHARELDPLSIAIRSAACWIPYWARDYEQAIAQARATLELDNSAPMALYVVGAAARAKGAYEDAITALEEAGAKFGDPLSLAYLGMAYGLAGKREQAKDLLSRLEQSCGPRGARPIFRAFVCAGLGENRAATDRLEKAFDEHDPLILWLRVSPDWDILRGDSRFQTVAGEPGRARRTRDYRKPRCARMPVFALKPSNNQRLLLLLPIP